MTLRNKFQLYLLENLGWFDKMDPTITQPESILARCDPIHRYNEPLRSHRSQLPVQ